MRTRIVVVAAVTLLGLLGGCSGGEESAPPGPTETAAERTPAASPAASSLAPSPSSPSPSTSSESPTLDGQEVTAADGALSWTMPCKPDQEDIRGNEEDKKTYRSFQGWRCGKRGAVTSGAFIVELVNKPANAEAARQAMLTASKEVTPKSKLTDNDLAGQPGISGTAELGGKEFGIQVISFDNYLALFIAPPPKTSAPSLTLSRSPEAEAIPARSTIC